MLVGESCAALLKGLLSCREDGRVEIVSVGLLLLLLGAALDGLMVEVVLGLGGGDGR